MRVVVRRSMTWHYAFFLGVGNDGVEDAEDVLTGDESPIHVVSLPSSPWRCRVCLFARPVCLHNSMA